MRRRAFLKILFALPLGTRAWAAPRPVRVGVDLCPYCNMLVLDARYAAQMVTTTGKVYSYDAIECLVDHLNGLSKPHLGWSGPKVTPKELYAPDFLESTREKAALYPVNRMVFLHHERIRTPMGGGLLAFRKREEAEAYAKDRDLKGALFLSWEELLRRGKERPWVPG
jgi:copper chaperone NosL